MKNTVKQEIRIKVPVEGGEAFARFINLANGRSTDPKRFASLEDAVAGAELIVAKYGCSVEWKPGLSDLLETVGTFTLEVK